MQLLGAKDVISAFLQHLEYRAVTSTFVVNVGVTDIYCIAFRANSNIAVVAVVISG